MSGLDEHELWTPGGWPLPPSQVDLGVLGPDSVAWRVYRFPTSVTVGFQRTALTEMFHPHVVASVADSASLRERGADRYERTLEYAATLVFGSSFAAVRAADAMVRVHARVRGTDPVTGEVYDPNDPDGQLWIHLTQWHSVLHVYERFGPGPLSDEDDRRYWAECAEAALFQTIDPAAVPRSREEMRDYYRRVRPRLVAGPLAVDHARLVLHGAHALLEALPVLLPRPLRGPGGLVLRPVALALGRRATVSTLPGWMREAMGLRRTSRAGSALERLLDGAATLVMRRVFAVFHRRRSWTLRVLHASSPRAYPVIGAALVGMTPLDDRTVPVVDAFRRAGRPLPREQYLGSLSEG